MLGNIKIRKALICIIFFSIIIQLVLLHEQLFLKLCLQHAYYVPRITASVRYYVDLLNKYQDELSHFIINSVFLEAYTRQASMNLIQKIQNFWLRVFFHSQVSKIIKFLYAPVVLFMSALIHGYRGRRANTNQAQNGVNRQPSLQTQWSIKRNTSQPKPRGPPKCHVKCNCTDLSLLFPHEFHWLIFHTDRDPQENRTPNEIHQRIMQLFNDPTAQPRFRSIQNLLNSKRNKTNDANNASLEVEMLPNENGVIENSRLYTGWSQEIIGGIQSQNEPNGSPPDEDSQNSNQTIQRDDNEDAQRSPEKFPGTSTEKAQTSRSDLNQESTSSAPSVNIIDQQLPEDPEETLYEAAHPEEASPELERREENNISDPKVAQETERVIECHFKVSNSEYIDVTVRDEHPRDVVVHIIPNPTGFPEAFANSDDWVRELGRWLVIIISGGRVRSAFVLQPEEVHAEEQEGVFEHEEDIAPEEENVEADQEEDPNDDEAYYPLDAEEPEEEQQEIPFDQQPEPPLLVNVSAEPNIDGLVDGFDVEEDLELWRREAVDFVEGREVERHRCSSATALCTRCNRTSWRFAKRDLFDVLPMCDVIPELREQLMRLEWPRSVYTLRQPH